MPSPVLEIINMLASGLTSLVALFVMQKIGHDAWRPKRLIHAQRAGFGLLSIALMINAFNPFGEPGMHHPGDLGVILSLLALLVITIVFDQREPPK